MGILLIIGGVIDYAVTPQIINKVNTLTNSLEISFLPSMGNSGVDSVYAQALQKSIPKLSSLVLFSEW